MTAGTAADIDALRTKVELQTRQQLLIQTKNDFAIQKLSVARVIGLAPAQELELTDKSPYQPFEGISVEEALKRAYASRWDSGRRWPMYAQRNCRRKAAAAGYCHRFRLAQITVLEASIRRMRPRYTTCAGRWIPIVRWQRHGDVQQADAKLEQSRERLESLRAQVESDVRAALLNLQSSADSVAVARSNIALADQTLVQSSDRFSAGVSDSVEVVQSQELVADAHEQYVSSLTT